MKSIASLTLLVAACAVAGLGACSRERAPQADAASPPPAESTAPAQAEPTPAAAAGPTTGGLGGTSWELVKIMSMDDTTLEPEDPSLYTLEFASDGTMRIRADCNRGTGSWKSESGSQLEFGIIAATQAACAPGSLHDPYMAQFQWVRSYVLEDGHLFLATMADGAIIEFAPATPAAGP